MSDCKKQTHIYILIETRNIQSFVTMSSTGYPTHTMYRMFINAREKLKGVRLLGRKDK